MFRLCQTNLSLLCVIVLLLVLGLIASPSWARPRVAKTVPTPKSDLDVGWSKRVHPNHPNNGLFSNQDWSDFWEGKERDLEGIEFHKEESTSGIPSPQTDIDMKTTKKVKSPMLPNQDRTSFWEGKLKDLEDGNFHEKESTSSRPFQQTEEDKTRIKKVESPLLTNQDWSRFWEGKERDLEDGNFHEKESTFSTPFQQTEEDKTRIKKVESPLLTNQDWSSFWEGKERDLEGKTFHRKSTSVISSSVTDAPSANSFVPGNGTVVSENDTDTTKDGVAAEVQKMSTHYPGKSVRSRIFKELSSSPGHKEKSEWDVQDWVEMWENTINGRSQKLGSGERETKTVVPGGQSTSTVPSIPLRTDEINGNNPKWDAEKWIEMWEKTIHAAPQGQYKEKTDDDKTPSHVASSSTDLEKSSTPPSPTHVSRDENMMTDYPDWNATKWVERWENMINDHSQRRNKDERIHHPEETTESLTEKDPDDLSLSELDKTVLRNLDLNVKHSPENSKTENSEIPISPGNLLDHRHGVQSELTSEIRDGTKMPVDDGHASESDDQKMSIVVFTALICVFCVVLVVLIAAFIFCLFCKKQAKTFSEKTTLNTHGNRFNLQVLRPDQKSIDAFTFGLPISTVDETLRNVVVDSPRLKY